MKAFQLLKKIEQDSSPLEQIVHALTILSIVSPFLFLLFGAYLQVSELYGIDSGFVRFISISQLFSDSLAFLFLFIIQLIPPIFLGLLILFFINNVFKISHNLGKFFINLMKNQPISSLKKILKRIILKLVFDDEKGLLEVIEAISSSEMKETLKLVINIFFSYLVVIGFDSIFQFNETNAVFFVFTSTMVYLIMMTFSLIKSISWELIKFDFRIFYIIILMSFSIVAVIFYSVIIAKSVIPVFQNFKKSLYNNDKLLNLELLSLKHKKYNLKSKILYFNDKFIFVGLEKDTVVYYPINKVDSRFHHLQKIKLNLPIDFKVKILPFEEIFEDGKKD